MLGRSFLILALITAIFFEGFFNVVLANEQILNLPNSNQGVGLSRNWAGYVATGGRFTRVSGTWVVPNVSNNGNFGFDATWVGIGGVTSNDLIQAGTQETISRNGRVSFEAWLEMLPRFSHAVPLTISSGDSITVSITQQSPSQWRISFKDNTSGQSYQTNESYNSSLSSAEWIEEAPSTIRTVLPLDNFGTIHFSNSSAVKNDRTLNIAQANGRKITMINSKGQIIAVPSNLGSDGASFNVTRTDKSFIQIVSTTSGRQFFKRRFNISRNPLFLRQLASLFR